MKKNNSLKILFVTNEIPYPPDNGVKIVSHHAMRLMYEAGHELALAVLTEETEDNEKRFQKIAAFCKDGMAWWMQLPKRGKFSILFKAMVLSKPFYIERYSSFSFRQKLQKLIAEFEPDVIHFDLITMTQYRDVAPVSVATVASINDSFSLALENYIAAGNYRGIELLYRRLLYLQTCRYEANAYPQFDVTHVMASADETYLNSLNPAIKTAVIPNGVDLTLFGIADQTSGKTDLIFVGKLAEDYLLYLEQFLKDGWPIIHRECPEVKLHIVGKIGTQAQQLCAQVERMEGVVLEGYVEKLAEVYSRCGISIVPINKSCGIINKAIEAMASGLVVVGFKKTFNGITEATDGEHFVSVEDYAGMGQSIVNLIRNEPRRRTIQENARQMAAKYYSWSSRRATYENMYLVSAEKQKK